MLFRNRDVAALVVVVILTRLTWQDMVSVNVGILLLFYYPTHHHLPPLATSHENADSDLDITKKNVRNHVLDDHSESIIGPAMMDVDGDGIAEAWIVIKPGYQIQILDLKQQSSTSSVIQHLIPSLPRIAGESPVITNLSSPKAVASGHLPVIASRNHGSAAEAEEKESSINDKLAGGIKIDDQARKFFCGTNWHDATTKCSIPCPDGGSNSCPENEQCFADTSCDYYSHKAQQQKQQEQQGLSHAMTRLHNGRIMTPAGSVPVVVSLWDGCWVRCDGLIANNETHTLELQLLWTVQPLQQFNLTEIKNEEGETLPRPCVNCKLEVIDAVTSGTSHGVLLISGYTLTSNDDKELLLLVLTLDLRTGAIIWETIHEQVDLNAKRNAIMLPMLADTVSSSARRRTRGSSHALFNSPTHQKHDRTANCLHTFKRSLLTSGALPHLHWTDNDLQSRAMHFDPQVKLKHDSFVESHSNARQQHRISSKKHAVVNRQWWTKYRRRSYNIKGGPIKFGRPNVIVTSTDSGLSVRSLKNGHELCQLSLWDKTLYADLNHDGVLDSVHIVAMNHRNLIDDDNVDPNHSWITQLSQRVSGEVSDGSIARKADEVEPDSVRLCHVQVLSGVPSKEELFSTNICGTERNIHRHRPHLNMLHNADLLQAAPPLLVEAMGQRLGSDIVTAVNSGVLTRIDGATGKKQWQIMDGLPLWEQDNTVLLTQVDASSTALLRTTLFPSQARPILLAGEDGMLFVSPFDGKKLASIKFPQPSLTRPQLMDVNGDGVLDVVVTTTDAVWAYTIQLRVNSTSFYRMATGFVLFGILLALIRNRFQLHSGKRSTDL